MSSSPTKRTMDTEHSAKASRIDSAASEQASECRGSHICENAAGAKNQPGDLMGNDYLIAIDPGTFQSGWVRFDAKGVIESAGIWLNQTVELMIRDLEGHCVIETPHGMGMPAGRELLETAVWVGRFMAAFGVTRVDRIYRRDVKLHLCGSARAKDPNVWQAIVDRYGSTKEAAIGRKSAPGPLYGITSHQRAALAVGLCWLDGVRSDVEIQQPAKGGGE